MLISFLVWFAWVVANIYWECHAVSLVRDIFSDKNIDVYKDFSSRRELQGMLQPNMKLQVELSQYWYP